MALWLVWKEETCRVLRGLFSLFSLTWTKGLAAQFQCHSFKKISSLAYFSFIGPLYLSGHGHYLMWCSGVNNPSLPACSLWLRPTSTANIWPRPRAPSGHKYQISLHYIQSMYIYKSTFNLGPWPWQGSLNSRHRTQLPKSPICNPAMSSALIIAPKVMLLTWGHVYGHLLEISPWQLRLNCNVQCQFQCHLETILDWPLACTLWWMDWTFKYFFAWRKHKTLSMRHALCQSGVCMQF